MIFVAASIAFFLLLWLVILVAAPRVDRLLTVSGHWAASYRYGDYVPVVIILVIGLLIAAGAGHLFLEVAEEVQEQSTELTRIDTDAHGWARTIRTPGATAYFTVMTLIGTPVGIGIILACVTVLLAIRKRWRFAAYLVFTNGVGGLLNLALKSFFARSRPELAEALRQAHGYSFPSGHAMGSAIACGTLAYLLFRTLRRWRWRSAVIAAAATITITIAFSRIYLGVHWISDVGAGIAAGTLWVLTTTLAYESFRRIRAVRALRAKRIADPT